MEASRHLEEEPDPHEDRLAHLSAAERAEDPSQEYDPAAEWELEDESGNTILRFVDRDRRPVVEPQPVDTPLTEIDGAMDFENVAEVEFALNDSPETVIQTLRDVGGVYTDEGEFTTGAYQLEVLHLALEGNPAAYEELPEDSGLRQWVDANRDSEEAVETFMHYYCIMHSQEETPGGETPAEAIVHLVRPEPPTAAATALRAPEPEYASRPRRRDRIRRRLRPLFGD
jgi:hypothetical protein